MVLKFIELRIMLVELKQLISPKLNSPYRYYISLADVRSFTFVYHESWQNDICSFRAMTVALTVSFRSGFSTANQINFDLQLSDLQSFS